ncbi:hypothetical protein EC915_1326, partial [Pseudomonas sp. LP_7_YM]
MVEHWISDGRSLRYHQPRLQRRAPYPRDIECDDLHRVVLRTQGKLTSCFGYDAMGRKRWQFASELPGEKLSQIHNPGDNSLLVDHAYNPIHRRYEYDPAGELTRTL